MQTLNLPQTLFNWINGEAAEAADSSLFTKISPVTGEALCEVARSGEQDIRRAVACALSAQPGWAGTPAVDRGRLLYKVADVLDDAKQSMAAVVAAETGKSHKEALGETEGAIAQARFMAGEGQRLYGRTTTSGVVGRMNMTVRQPVGVAGLIIAANTPIANIAWKFFPALIAGNTVVVKAAEDTPLSAWLFGQLCIKAGLPGGVWHIVQGVGAEAGQALVAHADVDLISFTGSTQVGRRIAATAAERMAKVSLELGGKNPLIVCDDADIDAAVHWSVLSAFSNAGQRCAAASRIIVFGPIYDAFKTKLLERTRNLRVGNGDDDDLGPVINEKQMRQMLDAVEEAQQQGASVLIGGRRRVQPPLDRGFFVEPTIIENADPEAPISKTELFGPITCLYRVKGFDEAVKLANNCPYGLTASIHTRDLRRAMQFAQSIKAGVASVNGGTHGSEPHMPFGGLKQSGNGTREPGSEAMDVYTELKNIVINTQ